MKLPPLAKKAHQIIQSLSPLDQEVWWEDCGAEIRAISISQALKHLGIASTPLSWQCRNSEGVFLYEPSGIQVDGVNLGPYGEIGIAQCAYYQSGEEIRIGDHEVEHCTKAYELDETAADTIEPTRRCIAFLENLTLSSQTPKARAKKSPGRL